MKERRKNGRKGKKEEMSDGRKKERKEGVKEDEKKLLAFEMKCLRRICGVRC